MLTSVPYGASDQAEVTFETTSVTGSRETRLRAAAPPMWLHRLHGPKRPFGLSSPSRLRPQIGLFFYMSTRGDIARLVLGVLSRQEVIAPNKLGIRRRNWTRRASEKRDFSRMAASANRCTIPWSVDAMNIRRWYSCAPLRKNHAFGPLRTTILPASRSGCR